MAIQTIEPHDPSCVLLGIVRLLHSCTISNPSPVRYNPLRAICRCRPLFESYAARALQKATKYYTFDSGIALTVAFLINLAVVCTFAKQFYDETCATASVASACFVGDSIDPSQPSYGSCDPDGTGLCQEIGLSAAAAALEGTLGSAAKYIWAIGLLVRKRPEGRVGGRKRKWSS